MRIKARFARRRWMAIVRAVPGGFMAAALMVAVLSVAGMMGVGVRSTARPVRAADWPTPAGLLPGAPVVSASAEAVRPQFVAPAPGSYYLPVIQQAPDGPVLDSDGRAERLARYTHGRITVFSFMYTYCSDPNGCPLAFQVLSEVRTRLLQAGTLGQRVQLVSLSFDPRNDTPVMMKAYGGALAHPASPVRWHFLTTRSVADLKPMIDDFGQAVTLQYDGAGQPLRLYHHLLKVFLLDAHGRVREIYTPAYLLAEVLWNDIVTLDFEQGNLR